MSKTNNQAQEENSQDRSNQPKRDAADSREHHGQAKAERIAQGSSTGKDDVAPLQFCGGGQETWDDAGYEKHLSDGSPRMGAGKKPQLDGIVLPQGSGNESD